MTVVIDATAGTSVEQAVDEAQPAGPPSFALEIEPVAVDTVESRTRQQPREASCRSCATGCGAIPDSIFRLPLLLRRRLAALRRGRRPPRRGGQSRTLHGRRSLNAGRPLQSRERRTCSAVPAVPAARRAAPARRAVAVGLRAAAGRAAVADRIVTVVPPAAAGRVDWASRAAAAVPRAAACPVAVANPAAADPGGSARPVVAVDRGG